MNKKEIEGELKSYFRYFEEEACLLIDGLPLIAQARCLQQFMDIVEDGQYVIDDSSVEDGPKVVIKVEVPEDIRKQVKQLMLFFALDKYLEHELTDYLDNRNERDDENCVKIELNNK